MRSKKRQTNIKLLESALNRVALEEEKIIPSDISETIEAGGAVKVVKASTKLPKKRGVPPKALINTTKLLTL